MVSIFYPCSDLIGTCTDIALELGTDDPHWVHHLVSQYRNSCGISAVNFADDFVSIRAALRARGF